MKNKNIIRIAFATGVILLLPLLAMQFTDEVAWSPGDFALAGALIFGAGLTYELVAGKRENIAYRAAVGLAVGTALFLVWANLAVGLIGNEKNPANLIYLGVLAVGIGGALVARFQAPGMARALFATAFAQALVAVIALLAGFRSSWTLNGIFVVLWLGAAFLFLRAGATLRSGSPERNAEFNR